MPANETTDQLWEGSKPPPPVSPAPKSSGSKSNKSGGKHLSKSVELSKKLKSVVSDKKRPPKPTVTYSCPHCDFETPNIVRHFAHKRQHRETTKGQQHLYKCHNCKYSSNIKGGLQRHIKRVHTKERPFTCPVCNFRTIDKPSMAKHIIKLHKEDFGTDVDIYVKCMKAGGGSIDEQPEACVSGNSGEENQSVDQEDIDDGSDQSYSVKDEESIDHDDQGQSDDISVDEQEEDGSSAEKGKKTDYVEYDFAMGDANDKKCDENNDPINEANAPKAKRSCTKNKALQEGMIDGESSKLAKSGKGCKRRGNKTRYRNIYCTPEYREMRARKLTCEYCHKVCTSRRELLVHMNEHKDAGIHCPICHLVLVDPDERAGHIKNHLENNPYVCATCLSTFAEESEVVAHQQREHKKTINIIMECMYCPFGSRSQERFTRHMTRCHMFGSEIPKHNPFDVSMMKKLTEHHLNSANKKTLPPSVTKGDEQVTGGIVNAQASSADTGKQSKTDGQNDNVADDQRDDLLDCSLLDMSGDLDESIDDIEKFLEKADQFHGFSASQGELSELVVKIEKAEGSARMPSPSFDILSNTLHDEEDNTVMQQGLDFKGDLSNIIHSLHLNDGSSERRATVDQDQESDSSAVIHQQEPSTPNNEHKNENSDTSHLTYSRISSIANSLSNNRVSISEVNVKKMKDHKLQVRNINRNSRLFKSFPSPDSTSGGK